MKVALAILLAGCVTARSHGTPRTGEPIDYDWTAFRQGRVAIDEHDFYAIAGDREAAEQIERERATATRYTYVGWGLALVGLGGLVYGATTGLKAGYGLAIALPIGGTMAGYGQARGNRDPQLSRERARETAARYNAGLGLR